MRSATPRKPVGTASFERIRTVKYQAWEDMIEVEFDSGISYLISNDELRKANSLSEEEADVLGVWVDPELRSGFFVRYANGDVAEASWEFVKEGCAPIPSQ